MTPANEAPGVDVPLPEPVARRHAASYTNLLWLYPAPYEYPPDGCGLFTEIQLRAYGLACVREAIRGAEAVAVANVSLDDLARIYETIPSLPVTAETAEAATNALLAFCYLPAVKAAIDSQVFAPAPWGEIGDHLHPLQHAIDVSDGYDAGPRNLRIVTLRMDEAEEMLARCRISAPPAPSVDEAMVTRAMRGYWAANTDPHSTMAERIRAALTAALQEPK